MIKWIVYIRKNTTYTNVISLLKVSVCTNVYVCACVWVSVCIYICVIVCTHACMCKCVSVCVCMCCHEAVVIMWFLHHFRQCICPNLIPSQIRMFHLLVLFFSHHSKECSVHHVSLRQELHVSNLEINSLHELHLPTWVTTSGR